MPPKFVVTCTLNITVKLLALKTNASELYSAGVAVTFDGACEPDNIAFACADQQDDCQDLPRRLGRREPSVPREVGQACGTQPATH